MTDFNGIAVVRERFVVTLPKMVREHMGCSEGDMVIFDLLADGSCLCHRYIGHRFKKNHNNYPPRSEEGCEEKGTDNGYRQND